MSKTVLITGINGFIGNELAKSLLEKEISIIGISRKKSSEHRNIKYYKSTLGEKLPAEVFTENSIDMIIHCAVATGENEFNLNVDGTKTWSQQCLDKGVKNQVFFSSISAMGRNDTPYARSKKTLEDWFSSNSMIVIRLGLVVGPGGLFSKMSNMIKKSPIIPLFNGGNTPTYLTGIGEIKELVYKILISNSSTKSPINFFQKDYVLLKDLLKQIRSQQNKICFFIPIPIIPVYLALLFIERVLRLNLGISSSSVKGIKENNDFDLKSDMPVLGIENNRVDNLLNFS